MPSRFGGRQATVWMAAAIACSALGMAFHTMREFGYSGLLSMGTGMIPVVGVQVLLFSVWWLSPSTRAVTGAALALTGVLQLIGGAIISVLPLPFLPFAPDQSLHHYLSHAAFGLAQIPLIVVPWRI